MIHSMIHRRERRKLASTLLTVVSFFSSVSLSSFFNPVEAASGDGEDWKSFYSQSEMSFGGLAGMGVIDSTVGLALLGTMSKKILAQGFVPDISNSVSIELEIGPVMLAGATALAFSTHLRWNFEKDSVWSFYALGGAGGNYLSRGTGRTEFFPRFGIGTFWRINDFARLRAEVSHELIGVGVNFQFF